MAIDSSVLNEVVNALKQDVDIKNTTYTATVSRIDGEGVVWVNLAGSDKETPTANTSAEVKPGDVVNVEWRNNKLYIGGNYSNPSSGVERVVSVEQAAQRAGAAADSAVQSATEAADAAAQAKATTDEINNYADSVSKTVTQVLADGETAGAAAQAATEAADSALYGLSTVEDVVGVLNWITAHGTRKNCPRSS